ncbi:GNAT family N-acetyltransferase [Spirulina subsalsa FACHB-351]|uniref:GNAT family N-acetyltransferase n=1 Tax=Spirulina subsalsa FACHB-351 TaxID=234711 RepID=A0ABT3L4A9_9CYAN|nr:GNAT family N-acetyltransferase [Spirulina subsalsa]MCW6035815.1 GNAT family N-acetyltransferase [Spirulina subsalsa FACHB-351]
MGQSYELGSLQDEQDFQRLGDILCQSFRVLKSDWLDYSRIIGLENFRVLRGGQGVVGGLVVYPMGQWWGGECLPLAGIAAVGIAPEYRGQGAARCLMEQTLREVYEREFPLSALYAATQPLYRSVGYEQGGTRCYWQVPLEGWAGIQGCLPMVRLADEEILGHCEGVYRQFAARCSGYLERHPALWQMILHPQQGSAFAYGVGEVGALQGYIVFSQRSQTAERILDICDWAALTDEAQRTLWHFLSLHRSQLEYCRWYGSVIEPRLALLPEQSAQILSSELWFLRIVNVPLALELRSYPSLMTTELHLAIEDPIIEENQGCFVLEVAGGKGRVKRGGRGSLRLKIGSLAPLYSGLYSAAQLSQRGQLEGEEAEIAIASQVFGSSLPAMPDLF